MISNNLLAKQIRDRAKTKLVVGDIKKRQNNEKTQKLE
jgi:hypothetical protein